MGCRKGEMVQCSRVWRGRETWLGCGAGVASAEQGSPLLCRTQSSGSGSHRILSFRQMSLRDRKPPFACYRATGSCEERLQAQVTTLHSPHQHQQAYSYVSESTAISASDLRKGDASNDERQSAKGAFGGLGGLLCSPRQRTCDRR